MCSFYVQAIIAAAAHLFWLVYNVWTNQEGLSFTFAGMGLFFGSLTLCTILISIDYSSCKAIKYNFDENGDNFLLTSEIRRIEELRIQRKEEEGK